MPVNGAGTLEFTDAGHLLGSAFARVTLDGDGGRDVVFSGDLGRFNRPVLPDPSRVETADVLLVESTYGDRTHEADDDGARLAEIITTTIAGGGKVIIPAFAIGRVEEVIYWLKRLEEARRIPTVPVYVDSPMAVDALRHYANHSRDLDPDMRSGRGQMGAFTTQRFTAVASPQQSKEVQASALPCIVISASGMASGGRVLHHLKAALPRKRNTVLFVGYQAAGTLGREILEGATEVRLFGKTLPRRARVLRISGFSAHADQSELLRWLEGFGEVPRQVLLNHGEDEALATLAAAVRERTGRTPAVPRYGDTVEIR